MSLEQDIIDNKVYVGHPKNQSNPKTRKSWAGVVNGQVIFDPSMVSEQLVAAKKMVQKAKEKKHSILVLCEKEIYKDELESVANASGVFFMNHKIPAGVLSNNETLLGMVRTLTSLRAFVASDKFTGLTKKEQSMKTRLLKKIEQVYKGVTHLKGVPDLVIIVDAQLMHKFILETEKTRVDAIILSSSNLNLWTEKHLVTCNVNSVKSLDFVLKYILS